MSDEKHKPLPKDQLTAIDNRWGEKSADNFGYGSDEERRNTRGLEDWELLESVPDSQKAVPKWFIGVVVIVLLVAVGLSFPFWGMRVGEERAWLDWGYAVAFVYIGVAATFVYLMVKYSAKSDDQIDTQDTENEPDEVKK